MELQIFDYQSSQMRTVIKDGEPWFVAKDVCEILEVGNTAMAIQRLSDSMKGVNTIDTLGGNQEMTVVSEAGVYKLVFTSRKPEAEKFTDWLATEVIPSIRKTGSYSKQPLSELEILVRSAQALLEQQKTITDHTKRLNVIEAKIEGSRNDWFTIKAYANVIGRNVNLYEAQKLGVKAAKFMIAENLSPGRVLDERFGYVNSYPEHILKQIFEI